MSNHLFNYVAGVKRPEGADKVVEKYGHYSERCQWYEIMSREYGAENIPAPG